MSEFKKYETEFTLEKETPIGIICKTFAVISKGRSEQEAQETAKKILQEYLAGSNVDGVREIEEE